MEANASIIIFEFIEKNKLKCISSDILQYEISRAPLYKREQMLSLLSLSYKNIPLTRKVMKKAEKIHKECKIQPRDALHIALAIEGKADYFLTCDYSLIKKKLY